MSLLDLQSPEADAVMQERIRKIVNGPMTAKELVVKCEIDTSAVREELKSFAQDVSNLYADTYSKAYEHGYNRALEHADADMKDSGLVKVPYDLLIEVIDYDDFNCNKAANAAVTLHYLVKDYEQ